MDIIEYLKGPIREFNLKTVLKRTYRFMVALSLVGLFALAPVNAQQNNEPSGNGFRISPVRTELVIEKGKSQTVTITVENASVTPVTARAVINNFEPSDDESGTPRLILDENVAPPTRDFKGLVAPIEDFQVSASKNQDVAVTISVPANAKSGGYYGAVRFVPILPGSDGRNVALTASVGSIFLIQVPGDVREKLDLVQFSAAQNNVPRGFIIGGKLNLITRLKNTGDVHVQPFGRVIIKNMFGRVAHQYEFNNISPRSNVLPSSTRKFSDEFPTKGLFGRYTVEANLSYSTGGGEIITAKTTFYYFSTIMFYLSIVLLILLIGVLYWVALRLKKRLRGSKK